MELDAQAEGVCLILQSLNDLDAVDVGGSDHGQAGALNAVNSLVMPGGDILQLGRANDVVHPLGILLDDNVMTLVVTVGSSGRHTVSVVVSNTLILIIVGDILDEGDTANDAHHLLAAAGSQGGDVLINAISHIGVVGDIAGGVDAFALVINGNGDLEQRGADVLTANEEHTVDILHSLGDIGITIVSGLDLIGIGLLELAGSIDVGGEDIILSVIAHSITHDLIQLHGDTAGLLDHGLIVSVFLILTIIRPGKADDGLGTHLCGSRQHGLGHGLGGAGSGIICIAVRQTGPDSSLIHILGPLGQVGILHAGKTQDDSRSFTLGDLGSGIEFAAANAIDQALFGGQIQGAFISAAFGNISKDAGLSRGSRLLRGKTGIPDNQVYQFRAGETLIRGKSRC